LLQGFLINGGRLGGTPVESIEFASAAGKRSLDLRKNKTNRPKRKKTLIHHLVASAGNGTTESAVLELIEKPQRAGHVKIGDREAVACRL